MTEVIEGQVVAKSDRNFGVKVGTAWYNAQDQISKDMILKIDSDYHVKIEVNGNQILKFMEVREPTDDDLNKKLEEEAQLLLKCHKVIEKVCGFTSERFAIALYQANR